MIQNLLVRSCIRSLAVQYCTCALAPTPTSLLQWIIFSYSSSPKKAYFASAKRLLRYLKGTAAYALKIARDNGPLPCYVDSDCAGDLKDRKSTSGIIIQLGGPSVYWDTMKQNCVALSSTEAEQIALCEATKQVFCLRSLLKELDATEIIPLILK